jgi:hypothetical protein
MFICGNLALKIVPPKPVCLPGQVGTYPNCAPACKVPGKETLPANDPNCKPDAKCKVPGKETLPANDSRCKYDPVAACTSLKIEKIANNYQFTGQALAQHGATVSAYVYTIKRDGKMIETKTVSSTALLSSYNYLQSKEGSYEVTLTIKTSLGDKTSVDCVKTFNIAPPEMCPQKPSLPKSSPECQPCPGDPTLWIKDEKCSAAW